MRKSYLVSNPAGLRHERPATACHRYVTTYLKFLFRKSSYYDSMYLEIKTNQGNFRCHHLAENWLCLSCKDVFCSRFINKHMVNHHQEIGHCLALSFSDLSVWCFNYDAYMDVQMIRQLWPIYEVTHLLKFEELTKLDEKLKLTESLLESKNLEIKKINDEKKAALATQFAAEATL
ncbi:uncharacterized protein LOC121984631 isoform X2 [Zingiber officinale]|uniref:uncharacterized protein LOC121984631 isoform X2 n=1 Tax=Zingiber officinale TaxID=94328 RepID=UPI001C4AE90E|nr:uncharacterized protein LOC121984631 isoform X2 [Zingiber officinale]